MLAAQRIAVVGLSDDPSRPSFGVAGYLRSAGKTIVPINPKFDFVMDLRCYRSLTEASGLFDIVDIFRRPEYCPDIVKEAISLGASGVWLQSGIVSPESQRLAEEAGIDFVQNRCLKIELIRSL